MAPTYTIWKIMAPAVLALTVLLGASYSSYAAWQPPLGIPQPSFGIEETAPPTPNPWTTPTPGFYYVDRTHPNATEDWESNDYGTPAKPRSSVPTVLPAGAVVEIRGVYDWSHSSPRTITANGTVARPVFIRGKSATERPVMLQPWEIKGSYFIVENLEFKKKDETLTGDLTVLGNADHGVVRYCKFSGNPNGGGLGTFSGANESTSYIVFYDNVVQYTGDWQAQTDRDRGGILVTGKANHIWIVDNESSYNGRDGIGAVYASGIGYPLDYIHHIYVGRNIMHHNRQGGFWVKEASDIIVSENTIYAQRPNSGGTGHGAGGQYNPERVWFLFNTIYDTERGITSPDCGSCYAIGNRIYNVHHTIRDYNPESLYDDSTGQAFYFRNSNKIYLVNNTMHSVDAGVVGVNIKEAHIVGNIISQKTEPLAHHINIQNMSNGGGPSKVKNNIFDGSLRLTWYTPTVFTTLTNFQNAYPALATGNLNALPLFVDPANNNFMLQSGSPAVDSSIPYEVYTTFFNLYGISINKDLSGATRPTGGTFDVGAFEFVGSGAAPPASPGNLRITSQ